MSNVIVINNAVIDIPAIVGWEETWLAAPSTLRWLTQGVGYASSIFAAGGRYPTSNKTGETDIINVNTLAKTVGATNLNFSVASGYCYAEDAGVPYMFVCGGYGTLGTPQDFLMKWNLTSPSDAWITLDPVPMALNHQRIVWDGGDYIYAMGGQDDLSVKQNHLFRYSISNNSWLGGGIGDLSVMPEARISGATVYHNGEIYYWGGRSDTDFPINGFKYNIANDSWVVLTGLEMPGPAYFSQYVKRGNQFITNGGYDGVSWSNGVNTYRFNFDNQRWYTDASLTEARSAGAMCLVDNDIYEIYGTPDAAIMSAYISKAVIL